MENTIENGVDIRLRSAWQLMEDKGLSIPEMMKVKSAITEWAQQFNPDVVKDNKHFTYTNLKTPGYGFDTSEEAKFFGAMVKMFPNANQDKLIAEFGKLLKLFDIKSGWTFNGNK